MANLQEARLALAKDREITWVVYRVLTYLEAVADYNNQLNIMQRDVVKQLGLTNSNVSRAFGVLVAKGIVEKLSDSRLNPGYRLNPNYGWRGSHGRWKAEKAKAPTLKLVNAA